MKGNICLVLLFLFIGAGWCQNRPPFVDQDHQYEFDEDATDILELEEEEEVHHGVTIAAIHTTMESKAILVGIAVVMIATITRLTLEIFGIHFLPESAIIIILGIMIGLIIWGVGKLKEFDFSNAIFFLILIPPIIFESGYKIDRAAFFKNLGLILMYALIGTAIVAFSVGFVLFAFRPLYNFKCTLVETLCFGSLIAAVDPVAVISIFNEMQVNETLYILVFGESVLNDAVSIVLYNVFLGLDGIEFTWTIPFLSFVKFLYVSVGGLLFGLVLGFLACLILRFVEHNFHVHVVETLIIVSMGWLSFLIAELCLASGIVSCMFSGMAMSRYGEKNLHPNSVITTNYILTILAGTTETLIFLFLGIQSVAVPFGLEGTNSIDEIWDNGLFLVFTLLLILPLRFALTFGMGYLENLRRIEKISDQDFFIISYGGLRGAIAFALAWELPREWESRIVMVNTVIVCIWFTVYIQGSTVGPIIKLLHVQRRREKSDNFAEEILPRVYPQVTECMSLIYGLNKDAFFRGLEKIDEFLESKIEREYDPERKLKEALANERYSIKISKEAELKDKEKDMEKDDLDKGKSKRQPPPPSLEITAPSGGGGGGGGGGSRGGKSSDYLRDFNRATRVFHEFNPPEVLDVDPIQARATLRATSRITRHTPWSQTNWAGMSLMKKMDEDDEDV